MRQGKLGIRPDSVRLHAVGAEGGGVVHVHIQTTNLSKGWLTPQI
jgi:hypothetical protein